MKPPESFVPLTSVSAPTAAREFRVNILNHAGAASGVSDGQGVIKPECFQSLEQARPTTLLGTEKRIGEPRVTVQRDGDRVTHLRIQCSCGQVLDLACVYDPDPPAEK